MNGLTTVGLSIAGLIGFSISWTAQDIAFRPSDALPPAIAINDIIIRADGSTVYDRVILTEPGVRPWMAWAGQIIDESDVVHCQGGDLAQYIGPLPNPEAFDANWLVGGDCVDGLEAGMRFSFTWTPIGPDYGPVRYPAEGYGIVQPALETQ